ncbi:hypothetical protein [Plantibacter sp. YIM 135347]|uniref:hypothetical protein n=1 Tax=Plantibacter sp. YIM 135347 TaxID=3423919 RepID=UPI003D3355C5
MTAHNAAARNIPPIHTDDDILERFSDLIGPASTEQVWFSFLDEDAVQLPVLLPIPDLPAHMPKMESDQFARAMTRIAINAGADSVIIVSERRGDSSLSSAERSKLGTLRSAMERHDVTTRAMLVSHDTGVRLIDAAELE